MSEASVRIARAIAERLVGLGVLAGPVDRPLVVGACREAAKAAIGAISVTPEMVAAGLRALRRSGLVEQESPSDEYVVRAILRAALFANPGTSQETKA